MSKTSDGTSLTRRRLVAALRTVARALYRVDRDIRDARPLRDLARAAERLSGRVAGCGCTDDDPELCAGDRGGQWCECPSCHGSGS